MPIIVRATVVVLSHKQCGPKSQILRATCRFLQVLYCQNHGLKKCGQTSVRGRWGAMGRGRGGHHDGRRKILLWSSTDQRTHHRGHGGRGRQVVRCVHAGVSTVGGIVYRFLAPVVIFCTHFLFLALSLALPCLRPHRSLYHAFFTLLIFRLPASLLFCQYSQALCPRQSITTPSNVRESPQVEGIKKSLRSSRCYRSSRFRR